MRAWYREPVLLAAVIAFGAAAAVALSSTERAFADAVPDSLPRVGAGSSLPTIDEQPAMSAELLARTVDHDLFHPERRRPATPFRLPAERAAPPVASLLAPASQLRLLGTVVTSGQDAFIMAQLGVETPRVVRVGGALGGFTLRRIEPGRAIFATPNGDAMDLHVPKAGPK